MISQNSDMPVTLTRPGVTYRYPKTDPTVLQVSEVTIEAGTPMKPSHTHPVSEIYYVARGKLRVVLGDEEEVVDEGCYLYFPAGVPHEFKEIIEKTVLVNVATPKPVHGHEQDHQ